MAGIEAEIRRSWSVYVTRIASQEDREMSPIKRVVLYVDRKNRATVRVERLDELTNASVNKIESRFIRYVSLEIRRGDPIVAST